MFLFRSSPKISCFFVKFRYRQEKKLVVIITPLTRCFFQSTLVETQNKKKLLLGSLLRRGPTSGGQKRDFPPAPPSVTPASDSLTERAKDPFAATGWATKPVLFHYAFFYKNTRLIFAQNLRTIPA